MPAFPKTEDVTKVREQATHALSEAVEQARLGALAALGAGDLATQTVLDTVGKVRAQAEAARKDLPNDLGELREKLDPAELRKRVDAYGKSAKQFYDGLTERGEKTLQKLQDQPQVKKVWDQVGTAQDKVEETVGDVRELADDVLGKVSRPFGKTEETPEEPAKAEEPKAEEPQAEEPTAEEPQAEEPTAEEPTAEAEAKPTAAKTTTAARKPTTKATTTKKPATN